MNAPDPETKDVKVSVCMITYNHEQFIAQAMESVLMQEVDFEYEMVIGEDCSTDETRAIVRDYVKRYPERIRLLLPEQNQGMMPNFVVTLEACHGQYVALLEGDDYWTDPHKLQKQVDFMEAHPECSMCFHRHETRFEDGSSPPRVSPVPNGRTVFALEDLLLSNFIGTPTVMYRQGLVTELPNWFFALPTGDRALHTLHAELGAIGFVDSVMAVYRVHRGGIWSRTSSEHRLEVQKNYYNAMSRHLGRRYQAIIRAGMSRACQREAFICEKAGDLAEAKRYLLRSIEIYPLNPHIPPLNRAAMLLRLYAPAVHRTLKWLQVRLVVPHPRHGQISSATLTDQDAREGSGPSG